MDELAQVNRLRSDVPTPTDLRAEERRLMAEISAPAQVRGFRRARFKAVLAGGLAAAGVVLAGRAGPEPPAPVIQTVAAVQVLSRAADHAAGQPELRPRPGQFLVFESQSMFSTEGSSRSGDSYKYLSRDKRKVWLPYEGSAVKVSSRARLWRPSPIPADRSRRRRARR
jgi:hypothetical protein